MCFLSVFHSTRYTITSNCKLFTGGGAPGTTSMLHMARSASKGGSRNETSRSSSAPSPLVSPPPTWIELYCALPSLGNGVLFRLHKVVY